MVFEGITSSLLVQNAFRTPFFQPEQKFVSFRFHDFHRTWIPRIWRPWNANIFNVLTCNFVFELFDLQALIILNNFNISNARMNRKCQYHTANVCACVYMRHCTGNYNKWCFSLVIALKHVFRFPFDFAFYLWMRLIRDLMLEWSNFYHQREFFKWLLAAESILVNCWVRWI